MRDHYLQQSVSTATPARLITMLYDRLLVAIERSTQAIDITGDHEVAHDELVRAQRIVDELRFSLDAEAGGEIAENLRALYDFSHEQLLRANLNKNARELASIAKIFGELREAWFESVELGQHAS
ncbi:MAG: flagellar export chaperone FliS [Actinobacteria bacterium]|nr:flagellar export chaperone FliS [Actinomycetota bacterium]